MPVLLEKSWLTFLQTEFEARYFKDLYSFLDGERGGQTPIYPPESQVFAALENTPFAEVKVLILGQDPYHGPNQAHGFCFSVNDGIAHPPSLQNIFKELQADTGMLYPKSGNLLPWARQGVLLLNATLTVRSGEAGSHQKKGWETFTDQIIHHLNREKEGLVFMLWGSYAKAKGKHIDRSKHHVLESGHPSPLSANRGHWFGNKHFSRANAYLLSRGHTPIDWLL